MSIPIRNGLLKAKQLDQQTLIPVDKFIASRGFEVVSEGTTKQTLLPKELDFWEPSEREMVFSIFDNIHLRTELRAVIKGSLASEPCDSVYKLKNHESFKGNDKRFCTTFEWYIGELLVRRFGAFSSSFSVEVADVFRNNNGGAVGNYDVLAVLRDLSLLYIECKTGGVSVEDVRKTLDRGLALHTGATVLLTSREIADDKIVRLVRDVGQVSTIYRISVNSGNAPPVYRCGDFYFIKADIASSDIVLNVRTLLRVINAHRHINTCEFDIDGYRLLGYMAQQLS
ncbi:MAG TPA: hypothetical protein V6D15_06115 [Oculatellaceae cyanobacterium]